jgi:hypothetical protein
MQELYEEGFFMRHRLLVKVFSDEHGIFEGVFVPAWQTGHLLTVKVEGKFVLTLPLEEIQRIEFIPEKISPKFLLPDQAEQIPMFAGAQ